MLVMAKCPNCGSNLKVDSLKEAAICEYCGTPFIVEQAVNNFNTYITNTTVNNINAENVNISNKNVSALANIGLEYFNNQRNVSDEERLNKLQEISKEILSEDSNNFYGRLFLIASGDYSKINFDICSQSKVENERDLLCQYIYDENIKKYNVEESEFINKCLDSDGCLINGTYTLKLFVKSSQKSLDLYKKLKNEMFYKLNKMIFYIANKVEDKIIDTTDLLIFKKYLDAYTIIFDDNVLLTELSKNFCNIIETKEFICTTLTNQPELIKLIENVYQMANHELTIDRLNKIFEVCVYAATYNLKKQYVLKFHYNYLEIYKIENYKYYKVPFQDLNENNLLSIRCENGQEYRTYDNIFTKALPIYYYIDYKISDKKYGSIVLQSHKSYKDNEKDEIMIDSNFVAEWAKRNNLTNNPSKYENLKRKEVINKKINSDIYFHHYY